MKKLCLLLILALSISAIGCGTDNAEEVAPSPSTQEEKSLPSVDKAEYIDQEILLAYHDLKEKGYTVKVEFENEAVEKLNKKMVMDGLETLDPKVEADREQIDAFIVVDFEQNKNQITLTI
ncbi:MAG: hypothetical protein ACRCUS_10230 [Anaerovoracaceae bacterium]